MVNSHVGLMDSVIDISVMTFKSVSCMLCKLLV